MENVFVIAKWIGAIGTIAAPIIFFIRKWLNHEERIKKCEKNNEETCKNINQILAENKIQTLGILACLEGLKEQGCNGAVTNSIKLMNDFINDTAHKKI